MKNKLKTASALILKKERLVNITPGKSGKARDIEANTTMQSTPVCYDFF